MDNMYQLFVRNCLNEQQKYIFKGNKEELMTLIGCIYYKSLIKIERIDYVIITRLPNEYIEISYYVTNYAIHICKVFRQEEEQENDQQRESKADN